MTVEPYACAQRVFLVVDNGSAHRGQRSIDRLRGAWPNLTVVHTPVHASWLNQAEIYFSVVQRKALQPNDFADLDALERHLLAFGRRYVDLLSAAARTPGGEIGLLRTAQVARILGRRRDWVHRNAGLLGGFRLPGSDKWRFSPQGVAAGVLGSHDAMNQRALDTPTARPTGRRLAYPPAKQTLADRPRRVSSDPRGGQGAPRGTRQR